MTSPPVEEPLEPAALLPAIALSMRVRHQGGATFEAVGPSEAVERGYIRFLRMATGQPITAPDMKACAGCGVDVPATRHRCEACQDTYNRVIHRQPAREHAQRKRAANQPPVPADAGPPVAVARPTDQQSSHRQKAWNKIDWVRAEALWNEGKTAEQIGAAIGCSPSSIYHGSKVRQWPLHKNNNRKDVPFQKKGTPLPVRTCANCGVGTAKDKACSACGSIIGTSLEVATL